MDGGTEIDFANINGKGDHWERKKIKTVDFWVGLVRKRNRLFSRTNLVMKIVKRKKCQLSKKLKSGAIWERSKTNGEEFMHCPSECWHRLSAPLDFLVGKPCGQATKPELKGGYRNFVYSFIGHRWFPETFQTVRIYFRLSGNFSDCLETFHTVWEVSKQFTGILH